MQKNRREFLKTSAGFAAVLVSGGCWEVQRQERKKNRFEFRSYRPERTVGKVTRVTPDDGFYLQTFYDVCPFSPSQRYLAVTRFPFQTRQPRVGETADVCVIDLEEQTIETVYATKGWAFQLGANLNWGRTDRYLYTNDIIDSQAVCVRLDLRTGKARAFSGPMYHLAPDESSVVGFPLDLINATQQGYGVPVDWNNIPQSKEKVATNQGIWKTDLKTNRKWLLKSIADLYALAEDKDMIGDAWFYMFHTKFNPQGTRISQVFRGWVMEDNRKRYKPMLFTFDPNGENVHLAVRHKLWAPGGHHPNWHPDGEHIIMNLKPDGKQMRFCKFRYDGEDFQTISDKHPGGGHPSVTSDGKYLVTDAYPNESGVPDNKEVPILLLDTVSDEIAVICYMYTLGRKDDIGQGTLRLDPHPAWSRDFKKVCFNGAPEGKRQVFIADLTSVV
ncbi:MAG: TolB-like translocation protein [Planctomycetota bacterium]|jgi:hypothetical protein